MTRNSVAKHVRIQKEAHPEKFCPVPRCLYRTSGGHCPNHMGTPEMDRHISILKAAGPQMANLDDGDLENLAEVMNG